MRNRFLPLLVVVASFAGVTWAWQEKAPAGKKEPAGQAAMVKEKLGLTDQQAEQLQAVMQEFRERARALREKSGQNGPTPEMQEEFKKLREDRDARVKAILTPEQLERFQQMVAQRGGEHGGGQAGGMGGGQAASNPGTMLKEKLGLTDAQAERLRAVIQEFRERAQSLRAKAQGQEPDPALREEYEKLRQERDTRLKAILTAEQFAQFQQMMGERARHEGGKEHPQRRQQQEQHY